MLRMFRMKRIEYLLNDQIVLLENSIFDGEGCVRVDVFVQYLLRGFKKVVVLGKVLEASVLGKLHWFE